MFCVLLGWFFLKTDLKSCVKIFKPFIAGKETSVFTYKVPSVRKTSV